MGEHLQVCNSITFCVSLRLCTCSCFCRRSLGRDTGWIWRPPVGGAVSRRAPDHRADAGSPPQPPAAGAVEAGGAVHGAWLARAGRRRDPGRGERRLQDGGVRRTGPPEPAFNRVRVAAPLGGVTLKEAGRRLGYRLLTLDEIREAVEA